MKTIRTSSGTTIPLDNDLLAVLEALYRDVTVKLDLDRSFDTGLFSRFRDIASLDAYTGHPEHQKVAALGREISEKVVSADFESEK